MNTTRVIDVALWVLLLLGFLGAARVSYINYTGYPCPHVVFVPICYLVLVAYGSMIASMIARHSGCKHYFFCAGWSVAFVIALAGSVAEIAAGGGVCPTSGGGGVRGATSGSVPLCFASLAMLLAILVLFLVGPYKRACRIHNQAIDTS